MPVRLQVRVYDQAGNPLTIIENYQSLQLQQRVNDFGTHTLQLDKKRFRQWELFTKDCFVEVLRSDQARGLDWYREYIGFHRTPQHQITEAGNEIFVSYGRSMEDLLRRRAILYFAGTKYSKKGYTDRVPPPGVTWEPFPRPADDIIKEFVRENIGEDADYYQRASRGRIPNWVTQENHSLAPTWGGEVPWRNLLEVIQDIANSTSHDAVATVPVAVDFKVILTSLSPPSFLFITGHPMIGNDFTLTNPPLVFGKQQNNITNLNYTKSGTEEVTIAVATGLGMEEDRLIWVDRNEAAIAESPWNIIELVRDDRNNQSYETLAITARRLLVQMGAQESVKFTPLQTSQYVYGRDYRLGDKVFVQVDDRRIAKRLLGVTLVSNQDQPEQLTFDFGDVLPVIQDPRMDAIRALSSHIQAVEHSGEV